MAWTITTYLVSYFVQNDWRRGRNKEPGERKAKNNIQFV
jgi:hypothetical protein